MKISYLAKHDSGGNDDEGAISNALEVLGHSVDRLRETKGHNAHKLEGDLLLFHKWFDPASLNKVSLPRVFWYFDLVDYPDPTLSRRNMTRKQWMGFTTPLIDIGFCTDGDWVAKDDSSKLTHLFQGADQRYIGLGTDKGDGPDILFTGIYKNAGVGRGSFVAEMQQRYGDKFQQVTGVHQRALADLLASSKIVVAPDHPITERYWSNRVYLTLGFGGFLLHPYSPLLAQHYKDGEEIVFYHSRQDLHDKINHFLFRKEERDAIRQAAFERTKAQHTYVHRCRDLIETIEETLL